jgi:hypothetical protein
MHMNKLYTFPKTLRAGDSYVIELDYHSLSATLSELKLVLRGTGPALDKIATISDGKYVFSLGSNETTQLTPGTYWYQLIATDTHGNTETVADSTVKIAPNLSNITGQYDGRSQAQRILDAIDATLENRATSDQQQYSILGRSITKIPLADLLQLRSHYAGMVSREGSKGANSAYAKRLQVRFNQ